MPKIVKNVKPGDIVMKKKGWWRHYDGSDVPPWTLRALTEEWELRMINPGELMEAGIEHMYPVTKEAEHVMGYEYGTVDYWRTKAEGLEVHVWGWMLVSVIVTALLLVSIAWGLR
jgi:hypothetical protein